MKPKARKVPIRRGKRSAIDPDFFEVLKQRKGRPPLALDPEQIERMAALQLTNAEIGLVLGCSLPTLAKYGDAIKRGREVARVSLRRLQFRAAMNGSVPMMIWLGKQILGQREPARIERYVGSRERAQEEARQAMTPSEKTAEQTWQALLDKKPN